MVSGRETDTGQRNRFLGVDKRFLRSHEYDGHGTEVGAEDGTEPHLQLGVVDPPLPRYEFCHSAGLFFGLQSGKKARIVVENPLTSSPRNTALLPQTLNEAQQQEVILHTEAYISDAAGLYDVTLTPVAVHFNLAGRAAGMFRLRRDEAVIRYNPWIFARWYDEHLAHTVPHEVAHYVVTRLHRGRRVRPHGPEWRAVMQDFGVPPRVTCSHDPAEIADLPQRRMQRYDYACGCSHHRLSAVRHNRVARGQATYRCRRCHQPLRHAG
jgi:SprT protein